MKTKENLNALKKEDETVSQKFSDLTEEELTQVSGGFDWDSIFNTIAPLATPLTDSLNTSLNADPNTHS